MMRILTTTIIFICITICGCGDSNGYSNESLYPQEVKSVYVKMFDSRSFRRGLEFELTDAVAKRIEAQTPYKVVSDQSRADSVLSGYIISINESVLAGERQTGRPLSQEIEVQAVVTWEDLKTGKLLLDNAGVGASASFTEWENQSSGYAQSVAANRVAERIVELMRKDW